MSILGENLADHLRFHLQRMTIDRRPQGTTISAALGAQPTAVLALSAQLTPSEREAHVGIPQRLLIRYKRSWVISFSG